MEQQHDTTLLAGQAIQTINGFSFGHVSVRPGIADIMSANRFEIIFNCGSVLPFSSGDPDSDSICCPASHILFVLPPYSKKPVRFETEGKLFRMTVDPAFLHDWFGSERIAFTSDQNLSSTILTQLMTMLSAEVSKDQIIEQRYTSSIALAIVNELYCQFRGSGKQCFSPKGKLSASQMKKVIDFVKSSLHSEIHLASMANEVHLSEFHFSRLFRNTFGISPYQYVLQGKVEYAKTLLRHYPRSLSQIAHSLNFTDQSHFTNVFKKLTGQCPSEFAMNRVKSVA